LETQDINLFKVKMNPEKKVSLFAKSLKLKGLEFDHSKVYFQKENTFHLFRAFQKPKPSKYQMKIPLYKKKAVFCEEENTLLTY